MAACRVVLHPGAIRDLLQATEWYRKRSLTVAAGFHAEVDRALRIIAEAPERWPAFDQRHRRVLVRRYPYSLVYRIDSERVVVVAVAHGRRRPRYWRRRST
ncbi:MAG: type II toxin-antitoxin system RelE/ParE family toxin [Planctomycetota bacterium]